LNFRVSIGRVLSLKWKYHTKMAKPNGSKKTIEELNYVFFGDPKEMVVLGF